jgi:hypothetical protein
VDAGIAGAMIGVGGTLLGSIVTHSISTALGDVILRRWGKPSA